MPVYLAPTILLPFIVSPPIEQSYCAPIAHVQESARAGVLGLSVFIIHGPTRRSRGMRILSISLLMRTRRITGAYLSSLHANLDE